jgi:flagellum-specific peptidoglycan hydrolase FlgJ
MQSTRKARWQQATALVSLSTCGAMTGFSLAHSSVAELTSPSSVPVKLMALTKPAKSAGASDSALRAAIVKSARYYLGLAHSRSPSAMQALIWQNDSMDGADHGESCAAFASLTLQSGAQATGQQSWVTGGGTYPWPVHAWVDSRVDPNPESIGVVSILQDAQAHQRWHPIGDGYRPQPGDWVLFDGHVEVVTKYAGGVLSTIGGDSMPNLSVNAHQYAGPLAAQGVTGFVNNGVLLSAVSQSSGGTQSGPTSGAQSGPTFEVQGQSEAGQADVPGLVLPAAGLGTDLSAGSSGTAGAGSGSAGSAAGAGAGGLAASAGFDMSAESAASGTASIPGAVPVSGSVTSYSSAAPSVRYGRSQPAAGTASVHGSSARASAAAGASVPDAAARQEFIGQIAPGALAAQKQYGIPASVTIAQAIDESGWGQSLLATQDNNLFGIKGTGPAGSVMRPTQEYENGQAVSVTAPFRVYSSVAQSINDHTLLLATGSSYKQAMADRRSPDAFANDLTGVYATDPTYGASLISIMRQYNLYRFDAGTSAADGTAGHGAAAASGAVGGSPAVSGGAQIPGAAAVSGADAEGSGGASIPGIDDYAGTAAASADAHLEPTGGQALRAGPRNLHVSTRRYVTQMPRVVLTDFVTTAKVPLLRAKPLYQQVADGHGVRWELLAACDWMQCQAQPDASPVYGEHLGTKNPDGTVYRTKADALEQCAADLIELAAVVYGLNLRQRRLLSVGDLASAFAAFRWGGLLEAHRISAMDFPYSVEGLTGAHMRMRWPDIGGEAPDKPGTRFRMSFGAVPVVLRLNYPALA